MGPQEARCGVNTDDLDLYPHERPHVVYRVFDARNRLLYVGCTIEINQRRNIHLCWGNNNSETSRLLSLYGDRWETEEHPDLATARAAERKAIHDEAPLLNKQHNPKRYKRVGGKYVFIEAAS